MCVYRYVYEYVGVVRLEFEKVGGVVIVLRSDVIIGSVIELRFEGCLGLG